MANATVTLEHEVPARTARPPLVTPLFALVVGATFAYFLAIGALVPALPLFVAGPLDSGSAGVGLAIGSFSVSALLLRPWAGRLGDRRGRRLLIVAGAAVVATSVLGYLLATSLPVLVALRALTGVGEALFFVGVVSAVNDIAPDERRGEAMSLSSLAPYGGMAVGALLSEAVLGDDRFFAVWLLAGGAALAATLLGAAMSETRPAALPPPASRRVIHPAGVVPGAVLLTIFWGFAGFTAFVPLYARDLGLDGSGLVLAVFSVILITIRTLGARIPDRLGPSRAGRAAVGGAAAGLAVIGTWASPAGLVGGTVLFALGQALAFPALMSLAVRSAPASERSAVVGTFTAFIDLAFGLGPVTLGLVARSFGYQAVFLAAAAVAGAGLLLLLRRPAALGGTPGPRGESGGGR